VKEFKPFKSFKTFKQFRTKKLYVRRFYHSLPHAAVIPNECEESFLNIEEGFLPSVEMTECPQADRQTTPNVRAHRTLETKP
jgi:hypothetical protein